MIQIATPALLFPAISLLLLAYTNRFLAIAALVRSLYSSYQEEPGPRLVEQLKNLRMRLLLIRLMQGFGIASLFCCVGCMALLFFGYQSAGEVTFAISLVLMMLSLAISFREIQISVQALHILLSDMEIFRKK